MQYIFPHSLCETPQQMSTHLHALQDLHSLEKPRAPELWKNWRSWIEMHPTSRPFWPSWRLTLFEDIGINETRFQEWYATRKNTFASDFFDVVFEFFFDQAYDIIPSASLKTLLYRLGMHINAIHVYIAEDKKDNSIKSLLFYNTRDPKILCLLPISFVYKKMLEYM